MTKLLTNKVSEKTIAWVIIAIFLLSLIPLFYISDYIHPTTDDYVFGAEPYHVWNDTHSFLQTVRAAARVTSHIYTNWQGTYSACFLMALQPGVFGAYWLTPFILILPFIGATYWVQYLILHKLLRATKWQYLIVATTFVLICMQCIPSVFDAFYWYNGGVYYTFYYAMCLFLAGCLIKWCLTSKSAARVMWGVLSLLFSLFIAGGNYVAGLMIPVLLLCAVFLFVMAKKRVPYILYIVLGVYVASFMVSILAPGNSIRSAFEDEGVSPLTAIWLSFTYGCNYMAKFTNPTICALFLFVSPILYRLAKRMKFSFARPWLFALATYALYCVLFTPTCYAFGFPGFERNYNVYLYGYCWWVMSNLFYLSGAVWQQSLKGNAVCKDLTRLAAHAKMTVMPYHKYLYVVTVFLFGVTILQTSASSKKVLKTITSGDAAEFDAEMRARDVQYKSNEKNLVFPRLTEMPETMIAFDISFDNGYWINQGVCLYYDKQSVVIDTLLCNHEKEMVSAKLREEVGPGNLVYKAPK